MNYKRTSGCSANRRSFMNSDRGYTYLRWDEELQREVPVKLNPNEDGVTEEWMILLDSLDHEEDLGDRYENENADYRFKNMKDELFDRVGAESAPVAENMLPDLKSPYEILFETVETDSNITGLEDFIHTLPNDRQNLLYAFYGERKYLRQITDEENAAYGTAVSYQAVQKRLNKAFKACCDYFGMPVPKKH